eukprot:scaffold10180_cov304-Chaetoceros_neogracile.AAC.7
MDRNIQIILVNATYSIRRTHEWWMKLMNGHNTKFRTFAEAVNLVLGGSPVMQHCKILELRCFMQCNNDLDNEYSAHN